MQVENAPKKSVRAALVKLGDKTSNVAAVGRSRPADWSPARCRAYVDWAEAVAAALPQALPEARAELARAVAAARLALG